jgi:hypothetical protein
MSFGFKRVIVKSKGEIKEDALCTFIVGGGHTEGRRHICNPEYARNRCQNANVKSIIGLDTNTSYTKAYSFYKPRVTYRVGQTVTIHNYCLDDDIISAPGIHYFTSKEAALAYDPNNRKHFDCGHPMTEHKAGVIPFCPRAYCITLFD